MSTEFYGSFYIKVRLLSSNMTDKETIDKVWSKGTPIPGKDSDTWRQDQCSTPMKKDDYGNRDSKTGWEIDHISPSDNDNLSNLRPLQWENNVNKSDGKLKCDCKED